MSVVEFLVEKIKPLYIGNFEMTFLKEIEQVKEMEQKQKQEIRQKSYMEGYDEGLNDALNK
jgi:hypothetical protein